MSTMQPGKDDLQVPAGTGMGKPHTDPGERDGGYCKDGKGQRDPRTRSEYAGSPATPHPLMIYAVTAPAEEKMRQAEEVPTARWIG